MGAAHRAPRPSATSQRSAATRPAGSTAQLRQRHAAAVTALTGSRVVRARMRTQTGRAAWLALDCLPGACDEIDRLARMLAVARRCHQNLAAAARATVAAADDGEPDPLYYLRDELQAQGLLTGVPGEPR